jgi:hypothetical protein
VDCLYDLEGGAPPDEAGVTVHERDRARELQAKIPGAAAEFSCAYWTDDAALLILAVCE